MPIPAETTRVHGITDDDALGKPSFRQFASSLRDFLSGCDFGGFNVKKFDLPILEAEFRSASVKFSTEGCRIIDAQFIYHQRERRDLAAAYKMYCGKELEGAW